MLIKIREEKNASIIQPHGPRKIRTAEYQTHNKTKESKETQNETDDPTRFNRRSTSVRENSAFKLKIDINYQVIKLTDY